MPVIQSSRSFLSDQRQHHGHWSIPQAKNRHKESTCNAKTWVQSLGWEDPLEEGMATHSGVLAWRIPMDREAWRATVYGVAKSRTQLGDQAQPTETPYGT